MSVETELRQLEKKVDTLASQQKTDIAVFQNDLGYIKRQLQEIKELVSQNYVQKTEFEPVKKLVYGMVALTLTSVMSALLYLVIQ